MNELDRYLDALGSRLAEAKPPRRRWPVLIPAVALVAALAVLLIGGPGGERRAVPIGPVDAVAKARAALTVADGEMLHMRLRDLPMELPEGTSAGMALEGSQEQWSTSVPQRWRLKHTDGRGQVLELAYAGGVNSRYDSRTDRLVHVRGFRDGIPQVRLPSQFGTGGGDPDSDLRAALDKGRLVDQGEVQAGGRTVRRLVSRNQQDLIVLTYDVDPQTFAPVGGSRTMYMPPKRKGGKRRWVATGSFVVEVYERVPVDEAVLKITPPEGTRVVTCRVKSPKKPRPLLGCRAS